MTANRKGHGRESQGPWLTDTGLAAPLVGGRVRRDPDVAGKVEPGLVPGTGAQHPHAGRTEGVVMQ
jgi:hypothetical protein